MPVQWKRQQHGGGMSAILGTGLILSVTKNLTLLPEGAAVYNINVLGRRLEDRAQTMEEGQKMAEQTARMVLRLALIKVAPDDLRQPTDPGALSAEVISPCD